jgi:hypothetical protein
MVAYLNISGETLGFAEALGNGFTQELAEALGLYGFSNATPALNVADLGIYNTAWEAQKVKNFLRNRGPIGYSRFTDLVPGDFKFTKAYIDFMFTSLEATDSQISLTEAKVVADVPDIIESGTATISVAANGAAITFSKTFHIVPRVVITPVSAAHAVPTITTGPSTTGFTAKLFNTAGTAITGTFIWTAVGY